MDSVDGIRGLEEHLYTAVNEAQPKPPWRCDSWEQTKAQTLMGTETPEDLVKM